MSDELKDMAEVEADVVMKTANRKVFRAGKGKGKGNWKKMEIAAK